MKRMLPTGHYKRYPTKTQAILSLPLAIANPFLPADVSKIDGALNGEVDISAGKQMPP
ncbi:MAG: hypothetical protein V8R52_10080 [Coprobacter fastidiosus]